MKSTELHIPTVDGVKLAAAFSLPAKKKPPVVVMVHGFAGNKDEKGLFVRAAECFYRSGLATVRVDLRGCGDSEGDLIKTDLRLLADDFQCIVDFVYRMKEIHAKKIYVVGFSLGAAIAVMGYTSKIKGMVLWSPALFPSRDMYPRYCTPSVNSQLKRNGYFLKSGVRIGEALVKDLRNCNLLPYIEKIDCPVLVVHGEEDSKIDIRNSQEAIRYFKKASLRSFTETGHSFRGDAAHKLNLYKTTAKWFQTFPAQHRDSVKVGPDQVSICFDEPGRRPITTGKSMRKMRIAFKDILKVVGRACRSLLDK